MNRRLQSFIIALVLLLGAGLMLLALNTGSAGAEQAVAAIPSGTVIINEIMTSNKSSVLNDLGGFSGWVELNNPGAADVYLNGYALTDNENNPTKWLFPGDAHVPAGGYLVVYLSGANRTLRGQPPHTSFKVGNDESLYLVRDGQPIDEVFVPSTEPNASWGRGASDPSTLVRLDYATPGYANTQAGRDAYLAQFDLVDNPPLQITEVVTANRTLIADADGEYHDFVEIYNLSDAPVSLNGYMLSDDKDAPGRWRFPDVTIQPHQYLLIFASNKDRYSNGELHASFGLTRAGSYVSLRDSAGRLLDETDAPDLNSDTSWARDPVSGLWEVCETPTPSLPNTEDSAREISRGIFNNTGGLYISEVMTSNGSVKLTDSEDDTYTPDWVELYNATANAVDLTGYTLTDNVNRPGKWVFPARTISAGERLILIADDISGVDDNGTPHVGFNLARTGTTLAMFTPDGALHDKLLVPRLKRDLSYGRDEAGALFYYTAAAPGGQSGSGYSALAGNPVPDRVGGVYDTGFTLSFDVPEGATAYYTLDCTVPTEKSKRYEGPITVSGTQAVRIRAFMPDGIPSDIVTHTYIVGEGHTLPVVSLVSDPYYFFSDERGIYTKGPGYTETFPHKGANFWKPWENPVHIEVFDPDEGTQISQNGGMKMNGQYSRAQPQKSLALYARKQYDEEGTFAFNPFSTRDNDEYKSFVMRMTGQDDNRSRMRDAVLTSMFEDTGVALQATQQAVLYINGQYWGHYNIRERVNKYFVAQFEGVTDPEVVESVTILKGNDIELNGSKKEYRELIDYVRGNDLKKDENLQYVLDRVDVDNYFTYIIAEILTGNTDNGNIKFYKYPDGKWKWILYDLDWALNTGTGVSAAGVLDSMDRLLNPQGTGIKHAFENVLIRKLLDNAEMREKFIARFAYLYSNVFTLEKLNARIDEYVAAMEPEMARHYERWPEYGSVSSWQRQIGYMREAAQKQITKVKKDFKKYFDLSDSRMSELFD